MQSNASLSSLDCSDNALAGTLDLTACASALRADVRSNPDLATVRCLAAQGVSFDRADRNRPGLTLAATDKTTDGPSKRAVRLRFER